MQAIQDYRYGFYDLDNPETPEEEALSEKSNWPLIPCAILALLFAIKKLTAR